MRVIAGEFKGRPLKAPTGNITRPTTDRVRESLMSALVSVRGGFKGAFVLDAFAGSGALGIEALSRGAAHATFCEKDAGVFRVLRDNIATLKLPSARASLFHADTLKTLPVKIGSAFDLVFLDPPYVLAPSDIWAFMQKLAGQGYLAPGALVVYEHGKKDAISECGAFNSQLWDTVLSKQYGDTVIDILRYKD